MIRRVGYLLSLYGLVWPLSAPAASFDCVKAGSQIEKTICSDPELSKLDDDLSAAYQTSIASGAADHLKREQRRWLAQRNACADRACIKAAYEARLRDLQLAQATEQTGVGPQTQSMSAQALKHIGEIASRQSLYLRRHSDGWCPGFLQDLAHGSVLIKVVEPAFRTEDENDQRLKQYHACEAGTQHRESLGDDPEAQFWSIHDIGYHAFRLYQLPGFSAHQNVEVLYAELRPNEGLSNQTPGYGIVNFERCKLEQFIGVYEGLQDTNRTLEHYNVMVNYRDTFYVLDAFDMRDRSDTRASYWMDLKPVREKRRTGFSCSWGDVPEH